MFTLLSEPNKKKLLREYRMRLSTTTLSFLILATLLGLVLLAPSYVLIRAREAIVSQKLSSMTVGRDRALKNDPETAVRNIKELMRLFALRNIPTSFSQIIDRVIEDAPGGVKINAVSSRADDTALSLVVSGSADDRETLSVFLKKLQADRTFTQVAIPVSHFAKSTDLEFAVSITVPLTH